jgi:Tol biopolymer transport system component
VTVIDWSTGDMALQDLATDEIHRVTDKGTWEESNDFGGNGKFSPDGARIAYAWNSPACVEAQKNPGEDSGVLYMEIRIVDRSGSDQPQTVLPCRSGYWMNMAPAAWSPEGDRLVLGFRGEGGTARLAVLDLASGELAELTTVPDGSRLRFARFSPSGSHLVYSAPGGDGHGVDVFAIPLSGGPPSVVVGRPGDDQVLGWESGGRTLLFQSQDGLSSGVFRMAVRGDVTPTGEAERVRSGLWRAATLGQTTRGYAYLTTIEQPQVHTAAVDLEAGRVLSPGAAVEDPALGESGSGTWSRDGQWLAYARTPAGGGPELVIRAVEGGEARKVPLDLQAIEGIWWAPDGSGLFLLGTQQEVGQALFRISLESGRLTTALTGADGQLGRAASDQLSPATMSPDGTTFIIARSGTDRDRLLAYDVGNPSAEPREIATDLQDLFVITQAVSPDGRLLAFTRGSYEGDEEVWVVPLAGGPARQVFKGGAPRNIAWMPDSNALLVLVSHFGSMVVRCDEEDRDCTRRSLVRVPMDGGEAEVLMDASFAGPGLRVHPGGEWVSFRKGSWRAEVWLMGAGA